MRESKINLKVKETEILKLDYTKIINSSADYIAAYSREREQTDIIYVLE